MMPSISACLTTGGSDNVVKKVMNIRKIEGLATLLESLSLQHSAGSERIDVFPWTAYWAVPSEEIGFHYVPGRCQYGTLRRLILQNLTTQGHMATDHLADVMALIFVLIPKSNNVIDDLEKFLSSLVDADVSQYYFMPASPLLKIMHSEQTTQELVGFFGHGPFHYEPFAGELVERVKYRLERLGQLNETMELDLKRLFGHIALYREPRSTKVLDFSRLGFTGRQPPSVVNVIQYYFDDLSGELFERFWQEHLESQYWLVAAGADLLDRTSLQGLTGTTWLTLFWGFDVLSANGMLSLITEDNYANNVVSMKIYSFGEKLLKARQQFRSELGEVASKANVISPSLWNFVRLVSRSRELENRNYIEESFTLLMVALESLLSARDAIADTLSRRAGALVAVSSNIPYAVAVKSTLKLYDTRSRFVHQGEPISIEFLRSLQTVCKTVFFAVFRSQNLSTDGREWQAKWFNPRRSPQKRP
jgi:hypothetical protein